MAQTPIGDTYIDEIIKSAGSYDPALNTTQGVKLRELFKLMRDRIEQGIDIGQFNPIAGTGISLSGVFPNITFNAEVRNATAGTNILITGTPSNYTIGVNQGRGANQLVARNENGDILMGRVAILGSNGSSSDDLNIGTAVQLTNGFEANTISKAARMQLGNGGDILFKTFTGPGDGTGSWNDVVRVSNASGNTAFSGTVSAISFAQNSLRSAKDNIESYSGNALEKINAIKISSFSYKNDHEKNFKVGFIADDTDPLFSSKDRNTMDIGTTLAISLKAIQELSAEVTQLKEKLSNYETV